MWDGFTLIAFPDESVNVLGAQVLEAGGLLYRDFVDSHGPAMFMLSQLYGSIFGWADPNGLRLVSVLLAVSAGSAVVLAPGLSAIGRLCALGLFAGWLAVVWQRQELFMVSFYPLGGALSTVVLATFTLAMWRGGRPGGLRVFGAGAALGLLGATAYSFWPSATLFAVSGALSALRNGQYKSVVWLVVGSLAGSLVVLCYLSAFGHVRGYLAFHIVENRLFFSHHIGFSLSDFVDHLAPRSAPRRRVLDIGLLCAFAGLLTFVGLDVVGRRVGGRHTGSTLLGTVGLLLLTARGEVGFKNGCFIVAAPAFMALAVGYAVTQLTGRAALLASLLVIPLVGVAELSVHVAPFTPFDYG